MAAQKTAPAQPAAPTPEPTPTPTETAPAPEPAAPLTPSSDETREPELTHETFGWDDWDEADLSKFPEPVRPWLEKANGRYKSKADKAQAELDEARSIYEALRDGLEDPRVKTLNEQVSGHDAFKKGVAQNMKDLIERMQAVEAEKEAFKQQSEAALKAQATQELEDFKRQNGWIFDGAEKQHAASELFDAGIPFTMFPELLKLAPATLTAFRGHFQELRGDGVKNPGPHALAMAKAAALPPAPSPAAELISGPRQTNPGPTKRGGPPKDASIEELELATIRRHLPKR